MISARNPSVSVRQESGSFMLLTDQREIMKNRYCFKTGDSWVFAPTVYLPRLPLQISHTSPHPLFLQYLSHYPLWWVGQYNCCKSASFTLLLTSFGATPELSANVTDRLSLFCSARSMSFCRFAATITRSWQSISSAVTNSWAMPSTEMK